jgi:TolB-like protein
MGSSGAGASVCRFADYELDRRTLELRKSGRKIKLAPQPARVLGLLASRPGELVLRDEIRHELWGDETYVDFEHNLNYYLTCIRAALRDTAQRPRYIETLARRGYRFIAPIKRDRPFVEPTLAVLPFTNLNGDPAREYFADGITDALITELARIQAVRVISRQSVLHLKRSSRKLDEIARELSVDGVVEGAVLHEGDRVRLTAQLILMEPERHAWAQSYDCDLSAVLTAQREAARAIAGCVLAALRPGAAVAPTPALARPVAPEIIETYLKASAELGKMSPEGIGMALQYFREVTIKAPDFALGLAGHAFSLISLGWWGLVPACEVYPSAKQMALKAIAIDDSLGEAHCIFASMIWLLDWDVAAAEREFQRAIELSPSRPEAHMWYAGFLCFLGRHFESISEVECALSLNPTALLPNQAAAWFYLNNREPGKAEALARRTLGSFTDSLQPHLVLGWAAWCQGTPEEAVDEFEKAVSLSRDAFSLSCLGHTYARIGRRDEAEGLLRELDQLSSQSKVSPIALVVLHAGLGNADAAFEWLETACRLRHGMEWLLTGFPGLDPLRPDPRFADLIRRMGIVPV